VRDKWENCGSGDRRSGFTLLEVIVTLALLSLVSLLLFDASITQWSNMRRISHAFERANSLTLRELVFRDTVSALIPAWPDTDEPVFEGDGQGFAGMTAQPLAARARDLGFLEVSLEDGEAGRRLVLRQRESESVLLEDVGSARFAYRALDGSWYETWPPEENPGSGFFNDGQFFDTPQLPETIRLTFRRNGERGVWMVPIARAPHLPFRVRDERPGEAARR